LSPTQLTAGSGPQPSQLNGGGQGLVKIAPSYAVRTVQASSVNPREQTEAQKLVGDWKPAGWPLLRGQCVIITFPIILKPKTPSKVATQISRAACIVVPSGRQVVAVMKNGPGNDGSGSGGPGKTAGGPGGSGGPGGNGCDMAVVNKKETAIAVTNPISAVFI